MVKKTNPRYDCIQKLKHLFNITDVCQTENDIIDRISIENRDLEVVTIHLMIDKMIINENFKATIENYNNCKKSSQKLFN